jgi:hypothetical protein
LPQLFTANMVARMRRYKPAVMFFTVHERIPFLGLAVVALFSPRMSVNAVLVLTFALLIWQGPWRADAWQSRSRRSFPPNRAAPFWARRPRSPMWGSA